LIRPSTKTVCAIETVYKGTLTFLAQCQGQIRVFVCVGEILRQNPDSMGGMWLTVKTLATMLRMSLVLIV